MTSLRPHTITKYNAHIRKMNILLEMIQEERDYNMKSKMKKMIDKFMIEKFNMDLVDLHIEVMSNEKPNSAILDFITDCLQYGIICSYTEDEGFEGF